MPFIYDIPQHPDDNDRDAYWKRKLKENFEENKEDTDNEEIYLPIIRSSDDKR